MTTEIDPDVANWAVLQLAPGGVLRSARGLRDGGAPWLVSVGAPDGSELKAVVRIGPVGDVEDIRTEAAALRFAHANGLAVPNVIAVRDDPHRALLLIETVKGSSTIPVEPNASQLRTLGAFAATLNALVPPAGFARRTRSIVGVDFAKLRREAPPQPLLQQAETIVDSYSPASRDGMVHGDLWQGNSLWLGDQLAGVIDWDCAGIGPAGIDLGSLRLDAAMSFGLQAAEPVLEGWESVGGTATDVPYWDLVAALSTPPEIDWFADAIHGQGRPDLTRELLRSRRDQFLQFALQRVERSTYGGTP
jgi:aminoglycoside phosphotransferase